MNWASLALISHVVILIVFTVRVISRDLPVSVTLAWLAIFLLLPYLGPIGYLLLGESQLGKTRARRGRAVLLPMKERFERLEGKYSPPADAPQSVISQIQRLARVVKRTPVTTGNRIQIFSTADTAFGALIKDIEGAKQSCHLLFYIWNDGGLIERLAEALIAAKKRGVECRLLLDAVGSKPFFQGEKVKTLKAAGVEVVRALPVALWRAAFQRMDVRNHRKIAAIDGRIGYTGSMNLADPRYFKQDLSVGEWVDVMTRVEGPAAEALNLLFLKDWELETGVGVEEIQKGKTFDFPVGTLDGGIQVVASGPDVAVNAIHEIVLSLIYAARNELIITSPYFVPTDPMVRALQISSLKGVRVTLVVPEKNDSRLVRFASESTYGDLAEAGVQIARFQNGLLHSKTITVDGEMALLGSVNMDMRSFFLNFEVSLLIYDASVVDEIRYLQRSYLEASVPLDGDAWARRSRTQRFLEKTVRLAGPLL